MKAEEAKLKSELVRNTSLNHIYSKVIKRVNEEVDKGERFAWIYDTIPEATKKVLANDGYWFTEESCHRNKYLIKINW